MTVNEKNKKTAFPLGILAVMAVFLLAGGCATTIDDLVREPYDGLSEVYEVSDARAWEITRTIMLEAGARPSEIEETRKENLINWVSVLGVYIEPVDPDKTRVTAQRPPCLCNPLPPPMTEDMFFDRFDKAIKLLKSAKPLPAPLLR